MARLAVKEDPGKVWDLPDLTPRPRPWFLELNEWAMFQLWIQSKILKGPERWVYLECGRTDWFQDSLEILGDCFDIITYQVSCKCSLKHFQWTSPPISASHSLRPLYPAHGDESTRSPSSGCCKIYLLIKSSNSNSSNNMQQDANTTTATTTTMPIHIKYIWFSIKISYFVKNGFINCDYRISTYLLLLYIHLIMVWKPRHTGFDPGNPWPMSWGFAKLWHCDRLRLRLVAVQL